MISKHITASDNALIDSWMDINEAVFRADSTKIQACIKKHVNLFHPIEQVSAEKRALDIVGRLSKSDAIASLARASKRATKQQQIAA